MFFSGQEERLDCLVGVAVNKPKKYQEVWETAAHLGGRIHNTPEETNDQALLAFGDHQVQLEFEVAEEDLENFERTLKDQYGEIITISIYNRAAPLAP